MAGQTLWLNGRMTMIQHIGQSFIALFIAIPKMGATKVLGWEWKPRNKKCSSEVLLVRNSLKSWPIRSEVSCGYLVLPLRSCKKLLVEGKKLQNLHTLLGLADFQNNGKALVCQGLEKTAKLMPSDVCKLVGILRNHRSSGLPWTETARTPESLPTVKPVHQHACSCPHGQNNCLLEKGFMFRWDKGWAVWSQWQEVFLKDQLSGMVAGEGGAMAILIPGIVKKL